MLFNDNTPELSIVASLLIERVIQDAPLPISTFPTVGVVTPNVLPLILATVVDPWVPVTSPANDPEKFVAVVADVALVAVAALPDILIAYVPDVIAVEKSPAVKLLAVNPEMVLLPAAIVLLVKMSVLEGVI